jgi:predicted Rossmann-fold nucleotide-binding protein
VAGFYNPLLEFLTHMRAQRFLKSEHLDTLLVDENVENLLDRFAQFDHKPLDKWIDRKPTDRKT